MAPLRDRTGLLQELERRQQEALAALDQLERELAEVIRQWSLPEPHADPHQVSEDSPAVSRNVSAAGN